MMAARGPEVSEPLGGRCSLSADGNSFSLTWIWEWQILVLVLRNGLRFIHHPTWEFYKWFPGHSNHGLWEGEEWGFGQPGSWWHFSSVKLSWVWSGFPYWGTAYTLSQVCKVIGSLVTSKGCTTSFSEHSGRIHKFTFQS